MQAIRDFCAISARATGEGAERASKAADLDLAPWKHTVCREGVSVAIVQRTFFGSEDLPGRE